MYRSLSVCLSISKRLNRTLLQVIVRPQSTVEYTSVQSVTTVDSGLTNLIHDCCSSDVEWLCLTSLQCRPYVVCSHSRQFALGWMCRLQREQVRRERESRLRYSNTTVYYRIHEHSDCIPVDSGVTNLIHDRRICVDFTLEFRRMWLDVSTQASTSQA